MTDLILITPPAVEPVVLYKLKLQCGLSPNEDSDHVKSAMLEDLLRGYLVTARIHCENLTRRVFITQTWQMNLDGFPRPDMTYLEHQQRYAILLPKQPFQSIVSVQYVDTTGAVQTLPQDTTRGNGGVPAYAFQLDPGSDGQPARLAPSWLRPWPPTRLVQSGVMIQWVAGYGLTGAALPQPLAQAVLCYAHSLFEPSAYKDIDKLVDNLVGPYINRVS